MPLWPQLWRVAKLWKRLRPKWQSYLEQSQVLYAMKMKLVERGVHITDLCSLCKLVYSSGAFETLSTSALEYTCKFNIILLKIVGMLQYKSYIVEIVFHKCFGGRKLWNNHSLGYCSSIARCSFLVEVPVWCIIFGGGAKFTKSLNSALLHKHAHAYHIKSFSRNIL